MDVVSSAKYVAIFDTLAALLAGLVIIPAVFAYGMEPNSGPRTFIHHHSFRDPQPSLRAAVCSVLFFIAVLFAGMTSLINLLESPAEALQSRFGLVRKAALALVGAAAAGVGLFVEGGYLKPLDGQYLHLCNPPRGFAGRIAMFWICGKKFARVAVQQGRKRPLGRCV